MNHPTVIPVRACACGVKRFDAARPSAANAWQFEWQFDVADRVFDGHFPHQPILAGVFLVEMAQQAAEFALAQGRGEPRRVTRVDRFRFLNPVLPGDACTLQVDWPEVIDAAPVKVNVRVVKGADRVAQGQLTLRLCGEGQ